MSEGLMLFDADQNLIYQNPASLRIHGFDSASGGRIEHEKLPVTWDAWDHPTGRPIAYGEWPVSRVFRGERFQDQVLRVVRIETGREFYASYNGCPIVDDGGRIALGFITIRDITEQVRAQEALRLSEGRLRVFFDSELMGAIYWTVDGRITDANDKFLRMVGYTRDDLKRGRINWEQMSPPEYRPLDEYALQELMTTGVDTPYEKEYLHKDGRRIPILIGAAMIDKVEGAAFVLDITDRKRAETELRASESQFRLLAESVPQLVWTARADGTVDYYNQHIHQYADAHQTESGRWEWTPMLHPADRQRTADAWAASVKTGAAYQVEHRVRMMDGTYRWHLSRAFCGRDPDGRIVKWFGTATDIDDQKRAQEILENTVAERTARLRETVAELEHFSYTITHDMRAPLRAMQAFGGILREEYDSRLDEQGRDYLRRITQAAARMDNLITDSLNYAKALQTQLALDPVEVGPLLRSIVESYPQFQPPRARIELEGTFPPVLANVAGLTQCFSNILSNAVKFVEPGTTPTVRVHSEERGQAVRIWFEDNGIGIPASQQARVFEMFQRLSGEYEGTGVGLALVQKVTERMHGRIGLESEPGHGSRFWLEFGRAGRP